MLPAYYEFQSKVKVLSGEFALENIPYELRAFGVSHPLLVSDHTLEKLGILKIVQKAMDGVSIGGVFLDVPPDSGTSVIQRGVQQYRDKNCDSIIAVGGGSVLDTAKGISMLIRQQKDNMLEIMGSEEMVRGRPVPFFAVPTTAGTGSEATGIAVISHPEKDVKMEFVSGEFMPDVAILDVRMTESLPPKITVSTGMDALCHAMEAFTCTQKNPLSDAYAAAAIELIATYLPRACADGKDAAARLAMANASLMAGIAFSNSMVGAVHAIGHALGAVCHVAHAEAMTILMPYVMEYNMDRMRGVYEKLLLILAGPEDYVKTPEGERAQASVSYIRDMAENFHRQYGLPACLRDTGKVARDQFPLIADKAINDGAILTNPKAMDAADVISVLERAF